MEYKATYRANANIALAKYWGKRDQKLILPYFSSLSVTLDAFFTTTTVEFDSSLQKDELILDDERFTTGSKEVDYLKRPTELIRELSGVSGGMRAISRNDVPTAAGLASSASGLAAFTCAAAAAAGLELSMQELSLIARQGSGSASRSLFGGFVQWNAGTETDGRDSFAEQLVRPELWPEIRIVACVVSTEKKSVSSRAGMQQTVETSPLYQGWVQKAPQDVSEMREAVLNKEFTRLGELTEASFGQLHASMLSTRPPIFYMQPTSVGLIQAVWHARETEALEAYVTMDAGPQVKILCLEDSVDTIVALAESVSGVQDVVVSKIGPGPSRLEEHLL